MMSDKKAAVCQTCLNKYTELLKKKDSIVSIEIYGIVNGCNVAARACFRKLGHVFGMDKKGHSLVNLGQFEHETPANFKFLEIENVQKNYKRHCMWVPLAISV